MAKGRRYHKKRGTATFFRLLSLSLLAWASRFGFRALYNAVAEVGILKLIKEKQ
jgi:hypothetical protein